MQRLTKWFRDRAAGAKRAVLLEDALLSGRFAAYAFYRMRYYIGRSLLAAGLHIAEVVFLSIVFTPHKLAGALLVRTAVGFAVSGWWGALEVMRADIRRYKRHRRPHRMARTLAQWLGLSLGCALAVLACFGGWLAFDLCAAGQPFDVFHLYVLANGLRLACSLFVRTFHSGLFALRRIYRPMWSLIVVDLTGFCGAILLWPLLGSWSVPGMLLVCVIMSNVLTFYFTAKSYRSLAIFEAPMRPAWPTLSFLRHGAATWNFLAGGCAYALARVDGILLFALFSGMRKEDANYDLLLLFYVLGPFVRACFDWTQLYYFDLKRIELETFANFKRTMDRWLRKLSAIVALVCWLLAAACGTLFLHKNLGMLYAVLAVFFLVRSRLALRQIQAFTDNRLAGLLISGAIVLAGGLTCRVFSQSGVVQVEWFILYLLFALFILSGNPPAVRLPGSEPDILGPLVWLARLKADLAPLRVRSLKLCPLVNDSATAQFAGYLARRVRKAGCVALLGRRRIVWWERAPAQGTRSDDWIWQRGAGLIESLRSTGWEKSGEAALSRAENEGLLGSVHRLTDLPIDQQIESIKDSFRAAIPGATVFDLSAKEAAGLETFPSDVRRELMYGLVEYSKNWFRASGSRQHDVMALLHQGDVRLVLVVDKSVDRNLRRTWRENVNAWNLGLAIGP